MTAKRFLRWFKIILSFINLLVISDLISIIIPSLNNLSNLKDCVSSIENQSYRNFEVLIIDGNSSDRTQTYLKSLKVPFNWISEPDKGIYDAMNKGVSLSKGEWLLFLGCDDKLYSRETLKNLFNKPTESATKLIIGKIKFDWQKSDSYFIKKNNGMITPSWSNKIWFKNTLPHQGIFYKRNLFNYAKYNINHAVLADYAFNLDLFKVKANVKIVNEIITICGTNGISKKYNWKLYKEEIKLKTEASSILYKPFFYFNAGMKYVIKRMKF